jgi:RND family efflux transporter MFP subunit
MGAANRLSHVVRFCAAVGWLLAASVGSVVAQEEATPVSISSVVKQRVAAGQTFVGTVVPKRTSTVGSTAADRVVEFPVNEGDHVEKGQLLARLRTTGLEIDLAAAKADMALRQQELAELENGSRPEEIAQARARRLAAAALEAYEKTRLNRTQRLFKNGRAAEDEMNEVVSAHERAVQAHKEAEAALALVIEGPRKEEIAQARARVQAQQEEIRRIQDNIDKHTITAPFDGYVTAEHTEVGQWLSEGGPVVDLVEIAYVDVRALVLEDYIRHLRVGTEARVEIGALPGEALTGRVVLIVPQADVRSRSFPVKIRLENRETKKGVLIKAGMFARVTLPVGEPADALLVPKDALILAARGASICVFEPQQGDAHLGRVRSVPVEMGVASGGLIEVKGAFKAGDKVVVRGNERLHPGQQVRVSNVVPTTQSSVPERVDQAEAPTTPPSSKGKQSGR